MKICEKCGIQHDGNYGTGRFCSVNCANSRNLDYKKIYSKRKHLPCIKCGTITEFKLAQHKHNMLCETCKKNKYEYTCELCEKFFYKSKPIKRTRKITCDECKRTVVHSKQRKDIQNLFDLSKRTISKLLKRANTCCALCGWSEASCDIHHIKSRKQGGGNEYDNLIIVCPNCHRKIHTHKTDLNDEQLKSKSIKNMNLDLLDFYHPSN